MSWVKAPFTDRPDQDVAPDNRFRQLAQVSLAGEARLVRIHAFMAPLVDDTLGIYQGDVLALHAQVDIVLSAGDARRSGTVEHYLDVMNVLAHQFECVEQRRAGDNGGPVLVIVEHGDLHRRLQLLLDVEALRRLDVFQVDAAEGRFQQLANPDHFVGIGALHFQVKDVHISEAFEEDALALHDWFAGQRSDVSQAQDRGPIGNYRHQVAARGVLECVMRILLDLQARIRHARSVGQAQIALCLARLGGSDFDFSGTAPSVVVERVLLANCHIDLLLRSYRKPLVAARRCLT